MPIQRTTHDAFHIPNKDPNRHYRWISADRKKLAMWLRSLGDSPGYRLEQGASAKETLALCTQLGLPAQYVDAARNVIRNGDLFLASVSVEEYDKRIAFLVRMGQDRQQAAREDFLAQADATPGVTAVTDEPEEFMEKKAHAEREDRPVSGQSGVGTSPALKKKTS